MKIFTVLAISLLLGACAPGFPFGSNNGKPEFVWVGPRCVEENPAKDGSVAFGPFGLKTSVIFFKQVSNDGTVAEVQQSKC